MVWMLFCFAGCMCCSQTCSYHSATIWNKCITDNKLGGLSALQSEGRHSQIKFRRSFSGSRSLRAKQRYCLLSQCKTCLSVILFSLNFNSVWMIFTSLHYVLVFLTLAFLENISTQHLECAPMSLIKQALHSMFQLCIPLWRFKMRFVE